MSNAIKSVGLESPKESGTSTQHVGREARVALELAQEEGPLRYSDFMQKLGKPDKTIYVTLKELVGIGLVRKDSDSGKYFLTDVGRQELRVATLKEGVELDERRSLKDRLKSTLAYTPVEDLYAFEPAPETLWRG
jgi:DNA-binding HxlR family transcriptional regulator